MKSCFSKHRFRFYPPVLFLLLSFSLTQTTSSQTTTESTAKTFNLKLQHTTLVVSNFKKSKRFYTEVLGLKNLNASWLPKNQMFLSLGNNLELHVGEVDGVEINPSKFNHFAISTNDLNGYLKHLEAHGVVYYSLGGAKKHFIQKRPDGIRQTFIQDPDGYWIEINDAN
ncbi:VOC family protein [Zhouia amylolytica]|uniref:VOC domain-containing protein n=1 Tax=Zhouia amylolytica AD3 TaxID=1286632 RepID=W2URI7_9FLAO|nr:VOC family protein [Zhouia amylolytica]ETN96638.1 hypothetical protein P278_00640 [Zhouia amylolytica AD3]